MSNSRAIEIDAGDWVKAVTFTANGKYVVGGGDECVRVWRVKDGEQVATMPAKGFVVSVAASKDGRFVAAGSDWGDVLVWNAASRGDVLVWDAASRIDVFAGEMIVLDVDFSPDSSRLVSAAHRTTVWDIAARKKVHTLGHDALVHAARYSPQGNRIATATEQSVQVWDSDDGQLLVDVKVGSCGLLWSGNHLFVKTRHCEIRQIDASTGSTVSEWTVPDTDSCIALPQHGKFLAYSTEDNITFWDTSTRAQLGLISRRSEGRSIAFSPDDYLLAAVHGRKIVIKDLSPSKGPEIRIDSVALDAWKNNQLSNAEALLTAAIPTSKDTAHHVFASRALVRARLQQWDTALVDAEKSIEIQSSIIGYIAKCVALVGKGDADAACRAWDIASLLFHSNHVAILLLIKAVVLFTAGKHSDAISRINDLIPAAYFDSTLYVVQAYMHLLHGNLHMESRDYKRAIQSYEDARVKLGNHIHPPPLIVSLISGWRFDDLAIMIQQRSCEALFAAGRTVEAGESVLRMVGGKTDVTESTETWVSDFIQQCLSTPEKYDNVSLATTGHNVVSHLMTPLLREWARSKLTTGSWKDALTAATGFVLPRFTIYQVMCEHLEMTSSVADAIPCFHQMCSKLVQEIDEERANWIQDFKSRCRGKLEDLGNIAMNAQDYDQAILRYTTALPLDPATKQDLLVKRSMAYVGKGDCDNALNDANEVIKLDPDSPFGYERKHAALRCKGDHVDAIDAYKTMLLKMSESTNPEIRKRSCHYVRPEETRETIRTAIKDIIHDSPPVLIDTTYGRLCNKSQQASAFEETPTFRELVSSMTTHIDHAHVKQEVGKYFRYTTFSHKWEENEPLFEKVIRIVVYELEASPAHEKLQMFCKIVREAGFNWAWSDTCCIDKRDHFVLQEALVSMFKWYERSAMTLIFLRGVDRFAKRGALTRSIWNMRAWTLQEYHASKVVRIYTEDWTPYLSLEIYNHKDSPEIISEMEEATGISAQALMSLRPGLDDIRKKLRLASTRQTTRVEDAAYSLLGIFSVALPITYGEGDKALGRLLAQLLASSGDMSILAWTGKSGSFNSCLPSSITVFSQLPPLHIPPAISDAEMGTVTAGFRSLNLTSLTKLYNKVNELPVPSFSGLRMKLPCLAFKLGRLLVSRDGQECVSRAQASALGVVEIRTDEDLPQLGSLYLACPWIDFLLDRQPVGDVSEMVTGDNMADTSPVAGPSFSVLPNIASKQARTGRLMSRIGQSFRGHSVASPPPPSILSPTEQRMRVLQFIARLRQPFGALLLTATRRNMDEYRRVAAERLIKVQVEEITPATLDKLIQSVRVLDVL